MMCVSDLRAVDVDLRAKARSASKQRWILSGHLNDAPAGYQIALMLRFSVRTDALMMPTYSGLHGPGEVFEPRNVSEENVFAVSPLNRPRAPR